MDEALEAKLKEALKRLEQMSSQNQLNAVFDRQRANELLLKEIIKEQVPNEDSRHSTG